MRERSPLSEKKRPAKDGGAGAEAAGSPGDDRGAAMITYPFPLRAGQVARLTLPPDLTMT